MWWESLQLNRYKSLKIYRKMRLKLFRLHYHRKTNEKECDKDQHTKYIHIISISNVAFISHFSVLFAGLPSSSSSSSSALPIFLFIRFIFSLFKFYSHCHRKMVATISHCKTSWKGRENHTFCGKKQIRSDEKKNLIIGAFKRFWIQIRTNTVSFTFTRTRALINVIVQNDIERERKGGERSVWHY